MSETETATDDARAHTQVQRAVAALRDRIVTGQLPPGATYLESELAAMLGMSRTPLREAAVILEGHGLVELRPRRGLRVLPLSPQDMEEIYSILTELESLAAQALAERRLAPEEIAPLYALLQQMEAALDADDRETWAACDAAFHSRLVALAGNRRLQAIVASCSDQVHRARLMTLWMRPSPVRSNAEHRELVDAIARGDADAARDVHRRHRIAAKRLILDIIERHKLASV